MMMDKLREQIYKAVKTAFPEVEVKLEDIVLEHPTVEEHGDYSTNIALKLKLDPKKIVERLPGATVAGPGFINFFLPQEELVKSLGHYDLPDIGQGKTVVIDYSAPNIARRFGIGHLRSTIIGQALYNIYKSLGYRVIGDNHLGDWGTQFGKLMYMLVTKNTQDLSIEKLEELYVEFHKEATPEMEAKARGWFKKLESGDSEARQLWQKCVDVSMQEFNKIYEMLGVKIDYAYGESFYQDKMLAVVTDAEKIAIDSEGAKIIEIPGMKTPLMLIKSDGATTYATRDLAALKYRQETWDPDILIYEVGVDQALYFQQLFAVARMLGYVKKGTELIHTRHGMYRWEHGRFRTREGNTPKLEEILNEAIERARGNEAVGVGAIKYFDLKHGVQSDIVFDWEKMFALEGDSGPYIQYTYARAKSVLRKSVGADPCVCPGAHTGAPLQKEEIAILRYLYRFPEVVEAAARTYSPNLICSYLFELAKRFNNFYNNCPIMGNDFRLSLTDATSTVLKNGLNLLGIEALEKM